MFIIRVIMMVMRDIRVLGDIRGFIRVIISRHLIS